MRRSTHIEYTPVRSARACLDYTKGTRMADKQFISAQMDSDLVDALKRYADEHGVTRSAALRIAIANLVGVAVRTSRMTSV